MTAVDAAAEVRSPLHAIEHRPVDTHLVRRSVAELDKSGLDIDLRSCLVHFTDDILALADYVFGRGHGYCIGLGITHGDAIDAPQIADSRSPGIVKAIGKILGADMRKMKDPGADRGDKGFQLRKQWLNLRLDARRCGLRRGDDRRILSYDRRINRPALLDYRLGAKRNKRKNQYRTVENEEFAGEKVDKETDQDLDDNGE